MTIDTNSTPLTGTQHRVHVVGREDDRDIDGFELFSARRALALLKTTLGRERLLDLLGDEIRAGDDFLRDHLARSGGQETTGVTVVRAHGITAAQYTEWLSRAFGRLDVMLAAHPEHYSIHAEKGRVNIVETLGDKVCSFYMGGWDESVIEDAATAGPQEPPTDRRSRLALEDGTVVGWISNEFEDEEDGFSVRLTVTLPATCAPDVIEQHLQHFAVEYRNWILGAAAELAVAES
ncbi:hypothetical protein GCM10025867_01200 [Frondihabitans sucicola]|uniref:Uncharacterized protein n=1 Tax=Frondihabitans sucicola TaxID=1268041 RepID=A0ABM8GI80_9MICO|nr:hypothetical protein [Frondihabitans sucicola]BDZ47879.1 hypothetical protein GCM10025867_01200 [Frondihabitans sucicola]